MIAKLLNILVLSVLTLMLVMTGEVHALQAGAAKLALELPLGGPLAGDVSRMGRGATDQHDPITVRALYLEDQETRILIVSADVYSITRLLREQVIAMLPEEIPAEHLILTATHTHNGPGGLDHNWLSRRYMGGVSGDMVERIAQGISEVMNAAVANKTRGTIGYSVSSKMLLNQNMFNKDGERDEELGVIRVDDSDGNPIAILGSLSAHPNTIGEAGKRSFSADFPGYFCNQLESLSHENTVAFFLSGAVGDQACANPNELSGWALAESMGSELAVQVKSMSNKIECKEYPITINYLTTPIPKSVATPFIYEQVLFQSLEINELLVSFVPGEPYASVKKDISNHAKSRGYTEHIMVGLCNDYVMDIGADGEGVSRGTNPGLNVLGWEGAAWCFDAVAQLMTRGDYTPKPALEHPHATRESIAGGVSLVLQGDADARGWQRGQAVSKEIESVWHRYIMKRLQDRSIAVDLPLWDAVSPLINTAPIALPLLAEARRADQAVLEDNSRARLYAMATGADIHSDMLWILQQEVDRSQKAQVFAVTGARIGSDGPLLGYVASVPKESTIVVTREYPESGRNYIHLGQSSDTGMRIGMNDAGLAIALVPSSGQVSESSVRFEIPSLLAGAIDLESSVGAAQKLKAEEGAALLILDRPIDNGAQYMDFSEYWRAKVPNTDSFLPDTASANVTRDELQQILHTNAQRWLEADETSTVYAVVMSPDSKTLYLAISEGGLFPETFQVYTIERGEP